MNQFLNPEVASCPLSSSLLITESEGIPKSPLFFYPLNSRTDNLFITRVKIFFLIHLILWEWEGRRFQPSFYSLQTINLPSSTSAVKTSDSTQTKAHKVPPGDMKESSRFFSVSPNIHTHTHTHTHTLALSHLLPAFPSFPISPCSPSLFLPHPPSLYPRRC